MLHDPQHAQRGGGEEISWQVHSGFKLPQSEEFYLSVGHEFNISPAAEEEYITL